MYNALVVISTLIAFALMNKYWRIEEVKTSVSPSNSDHPYRVAGVIDSYEEPKPKPKPKPVKKKREPIVLPKSMIVFFILMPAMLVDIGMGFAYDSTALGIGAKWGMFAAAVLTNIFFIVSAIAKAEEKK